MGRNAPLPSCRLRACVGPKVCSFQLTLTGAVRIWWMRDIRHSDPDHGRCTDLTTRSRSHCLHQANGELRPSRAVHSPQPHGRNPLSRIMFGAARPHPPKLSPFFRSLVDEGGGEAVIQTERRTGLANKSLRNVCRRFSRNMVQYRDVGQTFLIVSGYAQKVETWRQPKYHGAWTATSCTSNGHG